MPAGVTTPTPPPIQYRVAMPEPATHEFEVEMRVPALPGHETAEIVFPTWAPGSYLVRDFVRHVIGLTVTDVRGRPLPEWAAEFDCASWAQLFLKYIIAEPAVTCAIPATSNPGHLADNLKAGIGRLPDAAQRQRIRQLWDAL